MRVEVQQLPQSQVQLQIEIDPEMLGQAVNKAYKKLAGRYTVPGFRPGKAPRAVLERAIGPEMVLSEAADICMNDAYAQAIKDHDLHPLGRPDVQSPKSDEIDPEKPLSFTATVYVRPHAQLGDYRALRIAPHSHEVGDEDVDRVIQRLQDERATWVVLDDVAAESGDQVTLRLMATVGDETLIDQDSWQYRLNADEAPNLPIPGPSNQVIGMKAGESKDETITLAEDYVPADYASQEMVLHVELLELRRRVAGEIDEAFARTLGDFESVDALRKAFRQALEQQARRDDLEHYENEVVNQVVALAAVDAPPPLVDEELDEMMRQLQENIERERKISMDAYTRIVGKSIEQLREESRPQAEARVRVNLVLDAVAEAEDVQVPEQEIEAQVRLIAGEPALSNKRRRELLASEGLRQRINRHLRRRHTIEHLMEITSPPEAKKDATPAVLDASYEFTSEPAGPSEPASEVGATDTPSDQQNEQEN